MILEGACHCGALTVRLEIARPPGELPVRICGCTFCLMHRPRYTTDPAGAAIFRALDATALGRYRFGLRLADFIVCRTCGVFVGAYEPADGDEAQGRGVINVETLARASELVAAPTQFTAYDEEDEPTRRARRARAWTPATLRIG